jgi:hypothetical protein
MKDIEEPLARRAAIQFAQGALYEEDERLEAALRRWGTDRARAAMLEAGFVMWESVVVERRSVRGAEYTFRMGILCKVEVDWAPREPGGEWRMRVRTRSVLKSGKPGEALEGRSFRVADPAALPEHMKVVGRVDREEALRHPRIIRAQAPR